MLDHKAGLFTLIFGAGLISAQSLPISLSSSCSGTLENLLISPAAACMNLSPFLALAVGTEKSISTTVDNWLTGLCTAGSCSNENLAAIVANVTTGCAEDFSNLGVDTTSLQGQITSVVQQVYPTARKIMCLKDNSSNKLCATQTLQNLEGVIGPLESLDLSLASVFGDVQKILAANSIPNLVCTNCAQAAMNIVSQDFPSVVPQVSQPVQDVCGASFINGSSPDGITETAAPGQFSVRLDSGALTMNIFGMATSFYIAFTFINFLFTVV